MFEIKFIQLFMQTFYFNIQGRYDIRIDPVKGDVRPSCTVQEKNVNIS